MQHLQKTGGWSIPRNLGPVRSSHAGIRDQFSRKNAMSTGDGTSTTCPVAVRPPVPGSILKTTMLFENWFSASRYFPLGSIEKCPPPGEKVAWRGPAPAVSGLRKNGLFGVSDPLEASKR